MSVCAHNMIFLLNPTKAKLYGINNRNKYNSFLTVQQVN